MKKRILAYLLMAVLIALLAPTPVMASMNQIDWLKRFGDSSADDIATSNAIDRDGNVYVGGMTGGKFNGQTSAGGYDAFIRKYNAGGDILWTRQFGTKNVDSVEAVAVGGAGNIYVVGSTFAQLPNQRHGGGSDAYVRKYDARGRVLWTRQFGGTGFDVGKSVAVGPAGSIYVVGSTANSLPNQSAKGGLDAYVRKYSPRGGVYWTRQFGTSAADFGSSVAVDSVGQVYVAGMTDGVLPRMSSFGQTDAFIRKFSSRGGIYWTKQFGRASIDAASSMVTDSKRNVYVVGLMGPRGFARKFSPGGSSLWTRLYSRNLGFGAAVDSGNNLYLVGAYVESSGSLKALARKLTPGGRLLWSRHILNGAALGAAVNGSNKLYVVGGTRGRLLSGSSTGPDTDAWMAKFD